MLLLSLTHTHKHAKKEVCGEHIVIFKYTEEDTLLKPTSVSNKEAEKRKRIYKCITHREVESKFKTKKKEKKK